MSLQLEGLMPQATLHLTPTPHLNAGLGFSLAQQILTLAKQTGRRDAEAFGHWAMQLYYVNLELDAARAVSEGERALALARENELPELEAFVLNDIGRAYAAVGRGEEAFASFEQAYERWRALGNEPMMADALAIWSHGFLLRGQLTEAERVAREGLMIGRRIGNLWAQAFNSYPLGCTLLEMGQLSEAIRLFWSTAELAVQAGFNGLSASALVRLRWEIGALGLSDYGRDRLENLIAASNIADEDPMLWQFWRAFDHYFEGDVAGASEMLADVELPNPGFAGYEGVFMSLIAPKLTVAAGNPAAALTRVDRGLEALTSNGFEVSRADYLMVRGDALRALGRKEEALIAWREALAAARRLGARRAEWPALVALSEAEPDAAAAADYRRQAVEIIRYLERNIDEPELREAFLNLPDVRRILSEE
jgi:tetratricopeptide (TPR) repeat protein